MPFARNSYSEQRRSCTRLLNVYRTVDEQRMADDLDDLLDEVEAKFCRTAPKGDRMSAQSGDRRTKDGVTSCRRPEKDDLDDLLEDILDDDDSSMPQAIRTGPKLSVAQSSKRKCCPVFLGGSAIGHGIGTSNSQRACNQLRCTSCDFRIVTFDDLEWDPSCDYLFFRNNMPDCDKLRGKLKYKRGARAYACQCSWHSAFSLMDLRDQQQLKWVCGKHET
ncbi:cilia- and flagella-associated protein 418 isoform X2 [Denticeps clupeoides]|uniref:Cilia- and flagella-associated protein 418 n=1 Tax=Denticeps clupeoides TaxID=299321 RepID=A0AAY4B7B1_9TELE|nr:protein C8orf37 homolog isoform X2 [Denticeps clupeoides]